MRRCVPQRDGFARLAPAIHMITATTRKVLYAGPRCRQRRSGAAERRGGWKNAAASACHTVSKPPRSRYRSRAEARVGRTEQRDQTLRTGEAAALREAAAENIRTFGLAGQASARPGGGGS